MDNLGFGTLDYTIEHFTTQDGDWGPGVIVRPDRNGKHDLLLGNLHLDREHEYDGLKRLEPS